jgi:hypothetical protein
MLEVISTTGKNVKYQFVYRGNTLNRMDRLVACGAIIMTCFGLHASAEEKSTVANVTPLESGYWHTPNGLQGFDYDFSVTIPEGGAVEYTLTLGFSGQTMQLAELYFDPIPRENEEEVPSGSDIQCPIIDFHHYVMQCKFDDLKAGIYRARIHGLFDFFYGMFESVYAVPIVPEQQITIDKGLAGSVRWYRYDVTADVDRRIFTLSGDLNNASMVITKGDGIATSEYICWPTQETETEENCTVENIKAGETFFLKVSGDGDYSDAVVTLH